MRVLWATSLLRGWSISRKSNASVFFARKPRALSTIKAQTYNRNLTLARSESGWFKVMYNNKVVKSPNQHPLELPSYAMGELLLAEWRGDLGQIKEKPAPITSIIYRALDLKNSQELFNGVVNELVSFLHTDSICYFDPNPTIKPAQEACWLPLIDKIKVSRGLDSILISDTIAVMNQPIKVTEKAHQILLDELDSFKLAGFEHLTRSLKSFLLPLALLDGLIDANAAIEAALLEPELQTSLWGSLDDHVLQRSVIRKNTLLGKLLMSASSRA